MAKPEDERGMLEKLTANLNNLLAINPLSLVQTEKLGTTLDFREGLPSFQRIIDLFRPLRDCRMDDIPLPSLTALNQAVNGALNLLQEVQQFQVNVENPGAKRDSVITRARNLYDNCFNVVSPMVSYGLRTGADFSKIEGQARAIVGNLENLAQQTQEEFKVLVPEAQKALNAIRQAAAEAGVSQQAIHFGKEAETHKKMAKWWLGITAFFATLATLFAIYVLITVQQSVPDVNPHLLLHVGLAKIAVFSVLSFAVLWCGKSYKSHRHNYVVNRHRQNALSTFNAFVSATKDEQAKQTVLIEAARSVFAPQQSGYLGKQSLPPTAPGQILEVLRTSAED